MKNINDQKIQKFTDRTSALIDQLEALDLKQFNDRIINFKENLTLLSDHTIRTFQ